MTETKELVTPEPTMQMTPVEDIKKFMDYFEQVKQKILKPDDFETVTTTNKKTGKTVTKPYIKRSGWRKISFACNLSDRIVSATRTDRPDGSFVWHVIVEVSTQAGRTSTGSGACDTRERGWAHMEHDCYATAHTRAKNRAISDLVAGGVLSAEEIATAESEPASTPADESVEYELDQRIERAGLDGNMVGLETVGNTIVARMKGFVGLDLWRQYNDIMLGLGFRWIRDEKDKKNSRWERGE